MEAKRYYYWNLHRSIWSEMQRGKVIGHHPTVVLHDCEFRVRQAGRERVLREKKKNVHAFVVSGGYRHYPDAMEVNFDEVVMIEIKYNPFRAGFFYDNLWKQEVVSAATVLLTADKRVFAQGVEWRP